MSSSTDARIRDYGSNPSASDEQQALLQGERSAQSTDAVRTEGRGGDGAAGIFIWVAYAVFVLTTWATVLSSNPGSLGWFAFHPLLQSLSIGCFTYGILTLQPTSQPPTKAAGLKRHQIAMIGLGAPIIILGGIAMILQKESHGANHFTTVHGRLGLISIVWIICQALMGGSTVWFGGAFWGGGMRPKLLWKYHRMSGYIVFPLVLITAYLGGGRSSWVASRTGSFVQVLAFPIALLVILLGIYSRIRFSKMKFF